MLRVSNIKVERRQPSDETVLRRMTAKRLRIAESDITALRIVRESVDARKQPDIYRIYTVDVEVKNERRIRNHRNIAVVKPQNYEPPASRIFRRRPVIIGAGPSGLFCAYILAKAGAKPVIVEQGGPVAERAKSVHRFFETGVLDTRSNVQYGEGGAGTFSDGKLNSSVRDRRNGLVLDTLIDFGAPPEIRYRNKPHVGTDKLVTILANMRAYIEMQGGSFRFYTQWVDFERKGPDGYLLTMVHDDVTEQMETNTLIVAIGNAARPTFRMLDRRSIPLVPKPFAVGFRIQHPQAMINKVMYGEENPADLPAADYKLTTHAADGRAVYSFCMCPGGYVVNASSEPETTVVNGMSYSGRCSANANSAIVAAVDFTADGLWAGMAFQERIEREAYTRGRGRIPITTLGDFTARRPIPTFGDVPCICKGATVPADLRGILPPDLETAIITGLTDFGRRIPGFDRSDAVLAAVESRTSSPVRICRGADYRVAGENIVPIGEGAGYAGGIMSAAIDGVKAAEAVLKGRDYEAEE